MSAVRSVGLVGIENSHAEEIIRYLNVRRRDEAPARISAIVRGEPGRTTQLTVLGDIELVVDDSRDLLGVVDAVIVTSRDGAEHARHALPFLEAGVPVWVDKPLAATVADVDAMIAAAERGGAALTSSSALRWVPDTEAFVDGLDAIGPLQTVTVTGPADPASRYSGIFFYGIHAADVAQRLLPGQPDDIDVLVTEQAVNVRYRIGDALVTLELVRPDAEGSVPFWATVVGRHGVVGGRISLPDDYVQPGVDAFLRMLSTGTPPIPYEQLRAPISILESVRGRSS